MEGLRKLKLEDKIPFELLLLADETIEAIEKYIYDCDVFILERANETIAVFALLKIDKNDVEIKNIAVNKDYQGEGIGSYLLSRIKEISKQTHVSRIIVGTPDVSDMQIGFYEKNGFKKFDVKKNFFVNNYSLPIIENGIQLRDMQMLQHTL